jgi:hypothetical protein
VTIQPGVYQCVQKIEKVNTILANMLESDEIKEAVLRYANSLCLDSDKILASNASQIIDSACRNLYALLGVK